jgi:hypothetical protein
VRCLIPEHPLPGPDYGDYEKRIYRVLSPVVVVVPGGKVETPGETAQVAAERRVPVLENQSAPIANLGNPHPRSKKRCYFSTL